MTAAWVFAAMLAVSGGAVAAPLPEAPTPEAGAPPPAPVRQPFADEIARFAAQDAARPIPPCAFLFVGSSSIRLWTTLSADMAPFPVINRGFGGAHIADVDRYFDRVVAPYHPRAIVFYAGENDLWAGRPPQEVLADFHRFMELKTAALGQVPVYFVSLKPSKARAAQAPLQAEVNSVVRAWAQDRADLRFVDVGPAMLDPSGAPKEVFQPDGLHLTAQGYAIWTDVLKPVLQQEDQAAGACPAAEAPFD